MPIVNTLIPTRLLEELDKIKEAQSRGEILRVAVEKWADATSNPAILAQLRQKISSFMANFIDDLTDQKKQRQVAFSIPAPVDYFLEELKLKTGFTKKVLVSFFFYEYLESKKGVQHAP